MIIFLNGCSSAGKSTIAKALQFLSDKPLLCLGIDTFLDMMPRHYIGMGKKAAEGIHFIPDQTEQGEPLIHIECGAYGKKFMNAVAPVVKALADQNLDLILDEVLIDEAHLINYADALKDHTVYFIGVHCALEILEEREMLRGDRSLGLARAQINCVHALTFFYDFEVDTTHTSSMTCAKNILAFIQGNPNPTSFETLREKS